jgi:hypothetical protein
MVVIIFRERGPYEWRYFPHQRPLFLLKEVPMDEPLTFSFTPNKSDYIRALRAFSLHQRSTRWAFVILVLLSLCTLPSILTGTFYGIVGLIIPLVMLFYILSILFITPANVGAQVENNERLSCETTWHVDDQKIQVSTKFTETSFDWGSFSQMLDTGEYYLLRHTINKNMIQIIPKRAFASPEKREVFHQRMTAKLGPVKTIRSLRLPEPSKRVMNIILFAVLFILVLVVAVYNFMITAGY